MGNLQKDIKELIDQSIEGPYWDFKQRWYSKEKKQDLLLDIICMANNLVDHDGYIIIGVTDDAQICGVEEDERRLNQQKVIDFLKDKKFAHGCRPTVYVKTIKLKKEIDVIVIKNSKNTPYYLIEDYPNKQDERGRIRKYHIYTRIIDTNTARDLNADFDKVELLWKKRFGLDLSPMEKVKFLLNDTKSWYPVGTDGSHSSINHSGEYYHRQFPEYIIKCRICEERFEKGHIDILEKDMYWMNQLPAHLHKSYLYTIELKYFSTILYSTFAVFADNFRFKRTLWRHEILFEIKDQIFIFYCYVELDSIEYALDKWLCNSYDTIEQISYNLVIDPLNMNNSEYVVNNPYDVILCFENLKERIDFNNYIYGEKEKLINELENEPYIRNPNSFSGSRASDPAYIDFLCNCGKILNEWLNVWRLKK